MIDHAKITCYNLKMNVFIDCLVDENYDVVGGPERWEEIYNEYISLRENKSINYILELIKQITYLNTKVYIIIKCVEFLVGTDEYSREVIMELKQTGVRGRFDFSNKSKYYTELRAAISYSKKYANQAMNLERELDDYQKKYDKKKSTRQEFEEWAVELTRHLSTYVDYENIYVARYCIMMNSYDRFCEVRNAQTNNLLEKQNGSGQDKYHN